jgi:hypothetical protein
VRPAARPAAQSGDRGRYWRNCTANKENQMATTDVPASSGSSGPYYADEVTGWVGWIGFAGVMLILIGLFHAIAGFVGIFKDDYYVLPKSGLVVTMDYTAWGWTHLILGLVAIATGLGIMVGQMWARIVGVLFAVVSAVANLAFINAAPVWSSLIIVFDVLVIWALTVHGREMKALE